MKRLVVLAFVILCALSYMGGALNPSALSEAASSGEIVRLHVLANSDTASDQGVKLDVRDAVLALCGEAMSGASSAAEAYNALEALLPGIEATANDVLADAGMDQRARAVMGAFDFPERVYDGEIVPAGVYNALRVIIGEGDGQNWWCVMYPPLCLLDKDADKTQLKPITGIEFQSSIADLIKKLKGGKE